MRAVLAFALALLLLPDLASAACAPSVPLVDVQFESPPYALDREKTSLELGAMRSASAIAHTLGYNRTGGLTVGGPQSRWSIEFQGTPQDRGTCIAIAAVHLAVQLRNQVFVAQEFPPGTCMYREVLNHELKHVAANLEAVQNGIPLIKARMDVAARGRGAVLVRDQDEVTQARGELARSVKAAAELGLRQVAMETAQANAAIDTLHEYHRITELCRGAPELARIR